METDGGTGSGIRYGVTTEKTRDVEWEPDQMDVGGTGEMVEQRWDVKSFTFNVVQ